MPISDALAVPGGFEDYGFYEDAYSEEVANLVRSFDTNGKPIAAICVGALVLGHSGILESREATTYHLGEGRRRAELAAFGATVLDQPFVSEANICTSSCPSTAIDVALWLLGPLTGEDNAGNVRKLMGVED